MRRLVVASLASMAVVLFAEPAAAKWTRLSSDHFVFVGDASERDMRSVAERLERFRTALGRFFLDQPASAPPTVVVVFQNGRSFAPYKPTFRGKSVEVVGYFTATEDGNYIAVNAEEEDSARAVLFHEYAHFMIRHSVGEVPVWANEGLAGFYQTFEPRDGKLAMLGMPSADHLSLLRANPEWMPLTQLVAVDHDSPLYNEGDRRTLFYAESWALIHYLTLGAPARVGQLQMFLSSIQQGLSGAAAFELAFGKDVAGLERELRDYVRRMPMKGVPLPLDAVPASPQTSTVEAIGGDEAAGYLGELLAFSGQVDAARAYLRKVVDGGSPASRAIAALGLLEFRAGDDKTAFPLLEEAAAAFPEVPAVQRSFGQLLWRRAHAGAPDAELLAARARVALTRAFEMEPRNLATVIALVEAELGNVPAGSQATSMLRRVVDAAPAREDFRLILGEALIEQGEFSAAARYLGPVLARPSTPQARDSARQMLARIANAVNASADRVSDVTDAPR